jgi:hypothetical protein
LGQIREYIEQREREFARGDTTIEVDTEVAIVTHLYELLRRDIEANNPEAYISKTQESAAIAAARLERTSRQVTRDRDVLNDIRPEVNEKVKFERHEPQTGYRSEARIEEISKIPTHS